MAGKVSNESSNLDPKTSGDPKDPQIKTEGKEAPSKALDSTNFRLYEAILKGVSGGSLGGSSMELSKAWAEQYSKHLRSYSTRSPSLNEELLASVGAQRRKLEEEIERLKKEVDENQNTLLKSKTDDDAKNIEFEKLKSLHSDLLRKQDLRHLLDRVGPDAENHLLNSSEFREHFEREEPQEAFIISIDIRRSTELMLKAREPKKFAEFISMLARKLREVIFDNYGIFDKFTGDGILAFFPKFYSGEDAGFYALNAAARCHEVFEQHYLHSRTSFSSVLLDTGLGIGMDFGAVQLVRVGDNLTVVGTPVVYACRMGGAVAGATYLNQPAYERLFEMYSSHFTFEQREINFKHEGRMLAYAVSPNGKHFSGKVPSWLKPRGVD